MLRFVLICLLTVPFVVQTAYGQDEIADEEEIEEYEEDLEDEGDDELPPPPPPPPMDNVRAPPTPKNFRPPPFTGSKRGRPPRRFGGNRGSNTRSSAPSFGGSDAIVFELAEPAQYWQKKKRPPMRPPKGTSTK